MADEKRYSLGYGVYVTGVYVTLDELVAARSDAEDKMSDAKRRLMRIRAAELEMLTDEAVDSLVNWLDSSEGIGLTDSQVDTIRFGLSGPMARAQEMGRRIEREGL